MCPHRMVIQIYDQKIKQVIEKCQELSSNGQYDQAVKLINNTLNTLPIDKSSEYYELILKKQSYLYNNGQFKDAMNQLQMLLMNQGQQFIDKYFLCRIYLAMGSVSFKTTYGSQKYIIDNSLLFYNKAKRLYYQLLSDKDSRVVHNLQLKVKIYLNILLMIQQNHDIRQRQTINIKKVLGTQSKYIPFMKSSVSFDRAMYEGKQVIIDKEISEFLQNLIEIKSDILLLGDKQIIDYYKIFYVLLLRKTINNNLLMNVSYLKVNNNVYSINYVLQMVHQVLYGLNIQQMSYRNKVSMVRAVYGLPDELFNIIQMYINTYIIVQKHGHGKTLSNSVKKYKEAYKQDCQFDDDTSYTIIDNILSTIDVKFNKYNIEEFSGEVIQQECQKIGMFLCKYKMLCQFSQYVINKLPKSISYSVLGKNNIDLYQSYIDGYKNIDKLFDGNFKQNYFLKYFKFKQNFIDYIYNSQQNDNILMHQDKKYAIGNLCSSLSMCYYYLLSQKKYESALIHLNYLRNCQSIITQLRMNSTYQSLQSVNYILYDKLKYISQLQQSNGLLQTYAYTMAHDLISPIRGINNFVTQLYINNFQNLDEFGKESLDVIKKSAMQAIRLIQSSYQYSQIGKQLNKQQFDILQSVLSVLKKHSQVITKKNIIITVIQQSFIHNVYGDKVLLQNVISNLLSNAIKACNKKQSYIQIGIFKGSWLYIKDNGRGMQKIQQDKIFKLFYRGNYSNDQSGNGLGMAIVKRILDKHDSIITVQSQVGHGTTISFTIPFVK